MNKKIYNCPQTAVEHVSVAYGLCQAVSYTQETGIPISGDQNEGR